jgi:hypothetical protein
MYGSDDNQPKSWVRFATASLELEPFIGDLITYCQDGLREFSSLRPFFSGEPRPVPVNVSILGGCRLGLNILKSASGRAVK